MLQNEQLVCFISHKNAVKNHSQKLATEEAMKRNMKKVKQAQLQLVYCSLKAQPLINSRYETVSENMFLQNFKMNNSFCAGPGYEFCLCRIYNFKAFLNYHWILSPDQGHMLKG